ncbi:alpha/beta fold hydrolase [Subtercola sp. YIM 133946]|uniref:alpha/beta fold hydrolase n=1 Tax=Subtercola sp. YIM 133946 TaxID=3118909 RepID=UPI002F930B0C
MPVDASGLYVTRQGAGPGFVMLHPGGTDSRALGAIAAQFAGDHTVLLPDRRGHGRTPDDAGEMTFEGMADDTVALLENLGGPPVVLLGYSDGAVVALLVALRRPDLVSHLVFVSGVYSLDGWPAETLDDEVPSFMADAYAEVSPDGRGHYEVVLAKLRRTHELGPTLTLDEVAGIRMPVLIIVGDDDDMALEHIIALYRALPQGELAVVPHASHGVLVEKPELCADLIREFLRIERPATFAPVRRAQHR